MNAINLNLIRSKEIKKPLLQGEIAGKDGLSQTDLFTCSIVSVSSSPVTIAPSSRENLTIAEGLLKNQPRHFTISDSESPGKTLRAETNHNGVIALFPEEENFTEIPEKKDMPPSFTAFIQKQRVEEKGIPDMEWQVAGTNNLSNIDLLRHIRGNLNLSRNT